MDTHLQWTNEQNGGGGFVGSILLHLAIAALLVAWAFLDNSHGKSWGENSATAGAIQASMVSSLPLPPTQRFLDKAVLASDTPSPAPVTAKEKTEALPKPDELAIAAKKPVTKVAAKPTPIAVAHPQPTPAQPTKAPTGATAGIQIPQAIMKLQNGTASITVQDRTFGSRYAYYVDIVNRTVAQNWYTSEADPRSSNDKRVTLVFDITRDGTPKNVRVETPSGSPTLDTSALRAVQRVEGFGPLPAGDHITVEYSFDYRQP